MSKFAQIQINTKSTQLGTLTFSNYARVPKLIVTRQCELYNTAAIEKAIT